MRKRRKDPRPICDCNAYNFPHKVGGKCNGSEFANFHFYNVKSECEFCNCLNDDQTPISCDVVDGTESIYEGECYRDAAKYSSGEHLILSFELEEEHE